MGLYAKIVQSQDYRDAKLKTAADMLPDMLGPDALPFDLGSSDPTEPTVRPRTSCWYPTTPTSWTISEAGAPARVWTSAHSEWSPPGLPGQGGRHVHRRWRRPEGSGAFRVARMGHATLQRRLVRTSRDRHRRRGDTD